MTVWESCAAGSHAFCVRRVFVQHPRATAGRPLLGQPAGRWEECACECHAKGADAAHEERVSDFLASAPVTQAELDALDPARVEALKDAVKKGAPAKRRKRDDGTWEMFK